MAVPESAQFLYELGFTSLEADIYTFLLGESPATGYRIAQAIGKPAANTYKALEALEQKGAIIVEEGEKRLCRAVPHQELLSTLERNFRDRVKRAGKALATISSSPSDERIYHMRSKDQVMERCRSLLERARQVAIVDIFPEPLEELRPDIERAAARGIDVTVKVYAPAVIAGVRLIQDYMGEKIQSLWPGQWVNLVIDAAEYLLGFLTPDCTGVHQAVCSSNPYLASTYHVGISAEITLDEIGAVLSGGGTVEEVGRVFSKFNRPDMYRYPGHKAMLK